MNAPLNEVRDEPSKGFEIDEVLNIKGMLFKVVLIDLFAAKIALKRVSENEARELHALHHAGKEAEPKRV